MPRSSSRKKFDDSRVEEILVIVCHSRQRPVGTLNLVHVVHPNVLLVWVNLQNLLVNLLMIVC